ncbi:LysM peptidoglycan-binding domain-containing protein [Photobacterium toruni]|uniref:LysM peptidoglycan-binding domain-containing protein n=1 Tax=Photobacterium toruni TaxID=1935446 RepID=UPI00211016B5|nr:LysM domain-containing protein [Photobacterium toruni]MEC6816595.1 LysM domain-containing protein [Photobacterium toruni]
MRQWVIIVSFIFFIPSLFAAPQPQLKNSHPEIYVVKKGDTLWDISAVFLNNPWSWPQLWQKNSYIKNPHLIYPGDQLHLIWVNGKPQLSLKKQLKLSPKMHVVRQPITSLPGYLMVAYVAQDKLISAKAITTQPQILGSSEERGYLSVGDILWADQSLVPTSQWRVYRLEQKFDRDDDQDEVTGSAIKATISTLKEIADVSVIASDGVTSQLKVDNFQQEIIPNDILLPLLGSENQADLSFSPTTPPATLSATVLGQISGYSYISNYDVVVLDRGHLDGMVAGQVFELFKPGAQVQGKKGQYHYQTSTLLTDSTQLGTVAVAQAMVLRPYEYFSLAVVLNNQRPFKPGVIAQAPYL